MEQQEVFIEIIQLLNRSNISYMLIGGLAVGIWGKPRSTHDFDIIIAIISEDKNMIIKAVNERDWYISGEAIDEALKSERVFNVLVPQEGFKVDFWILKKDVYSQEAFGRRVKQRILGEDIFVITAEDLILSKLRWFQESKSSRHLLDAQGVFNLQKERLNIEYLKSWAEKLDVENLLKDLRKNKFYNF